MIYLELQKNYTSKKVKNQRVDYHPKTIQLGFVVDKSDMGCVLATCYHSNTNLEDFLVFAQKLKLTHSIDCLPYLRL